MENARHPPPEPTLRGLLDSRAELPSPPSPYCEMAQRRPPADNGPNMTPVLIVVAAIVAVVGFLAVSGNDKNAQADEPEVKGIEGTPAGSGDPFADVPDVEPPRPRTVNTAPPGLLDNADYVRACEIAREGIGIIDGAVKLRNGGDEEGYQARAREGKAKLVQAKEMTTDWLMDLQDKYPGDRQLRQIENERRKWDKKLKLVKNLK